MVHRDPETGQFVPDGTSYEDVEVVTFRAGVGVEASNLSGTTGFGGESFAFEGLELVDYDDVVDRNEELQLLTADHRLVAYVNSTETADGALAASVEVSSAPSRQSAAVLTGQNALGDATSGVVGGADQEDSIDMLGRPLMTKAGAPFSDGASGVGGGGSSGDDSTTVDNPPGVVGSFHPRDELFLNGNLKTWNIADAGVHVQVQGQHVYGVQSQ